MFLLCPAALDSSSAFWDALRRSPFHRRIRICLFGLQKLSSSLRNSMAAAGPEFPMVTHSPILPIVTARPYARKARIGAVPNRVDLLSAFSSVRCRRGRTVPKCSWTRTDARISRLVGKRGRGGGRIDVRIIGTDRRTRTGISSPDRMAYRCFSSVSPVSLLWLRRRNNTRESNCLYALHALFFDKRSGC